MRLEDDRSVWFYLGLLVVVFFGIYFIFLAACEIDLSKREALYPGEFHAYRVRVINELRVDLTIVEDNSYDYTEIRRNSETDITAYGRGAVHDLPVFEEAEGQDFVEDIYGDRHYFDVSLHRNVNWTPMTRILIRGIGGDYEDTFIPEDILDWEEEEDE
jgi:hypothetical protein